MGSDSLQVVVIARGWRQWMLVLLLALPGPLAVASSPLADHPSPYIALHADDPVQWRTWHPDLLREAQRDGRLLFISSGYFACHWCHVMQRESFRNPDIAALLNRLTVPVKVDRELQPALDAQLIEFVRETRGHAGWPLNVFLTPEGFPLLGLVYAPPEDFLVLVQNLQRAWRAESAELSRLARAAAQELHGQDEGRKARPLRGADLLAAFETALWAKADDFEGGFGDQAKFPHVPQLQVLLDLQAAQPDARRAAFLRLTLNQMARLGLRDHLGGGFFRYTTDPGWREPHFEKMLYDNAQLLGLYARAAEVLGETEWLEVAVDTFDFLYGMMRADNGGYVSSLSALDDEAVEGGYYLWSNAELERLLDAEERRLAALWYGMQGNAPFAAGHLPLRLTQAAEVQAATGMSGELLRTGLERVEGKLLEARRARVLPRDDKQLASWNGLLLQGLVELARASGKASHQQAARELRDFLLRELVEDDVVYRVRREGSHALPGDLEDYAQVARGLLEWAQYVGSEEDRARAHALVRRAWQEFHGDGGWRLSAEELIALPVWRPAVEDGALPSPVASLVAVSRRLASYEQDDRLSVRVREALSRAAPYVAGAPFDHASHVSLLGLPGLAEARYPR
ncbi:MAG TPA: DUF255 domain-containing protein [Gammaproteobacteria bacterium]